MDETTSLLPTTVPLPSPGRTTEHRRGRRHVRLLIKITAALAVIVALLVAASFVLRSEWFLRRRIDPKLEKLGEKLHGEFRYDSVSPAGLTGVTVEGLTFEPDSGVELASPLTIDKLVVYPDLGAMIVGDLQPRSLEIHGLRAEFWLDGGDTGRGHLPWLETVVDSWSNAPENARAHGGQGDGARQVPEVRILGGRLDVVSPGGKMPHMGASVDDLTIREVDAQLQLDGAIHVDGLGYALLSGGANRRSRRGGVVVELKDKPDLLDVADGADDRLDELMDIVGPDSRLEVGGVSVHWPPAITVHGARITDTRIGVPGHEQAWIEEVGVGSITVRLQDQRAEVGITDLDASLRVEWFEALGTSLPLYLPRLDAVVDLDGHRVGAGFELDAGDGGKLSLQTAIDLDALDLAVQVEARQFDAGRMLSFVPYTGPVDVTSGIVDGHVAMRFPLSDELVEIDAFLNLSRLTAEVPWLAEHTLENADFTVDVRSRVDLREGRLKIEDAMLGIGEVMMSVSADVAKIDHGRDIRIEASLHGDDLLAGELIDNLPRGFAPALEGYRLDGRFSLEMALALDTRDVEAMELDFDLDLDQVEVLEHGPRADIPVLAGDDFAVRISTATDGTVISPSDPTTWTPMYRLPRHVAASLIASEDGRFFTHDGFDSRAIRNSLVANLSAGRIVRGGSTISQQVIKNLFLSQSKTVSRKLQEAFLTWQLEQHIDKDRILELYVNLAHWGVDIYGIRDAARFYFDKRPGQLTVRESLFLAAILPNPIRFGGQYQRGVLEADRLRKMRNGLLALKRRGLLDGAGYQRELSKIDRGIISSQPPPPLAADLDSANPEACAH